MEGQMIRLLKPEEIECRVATINEKGLSLLLFKDARVDQKILDETFTPFGWKRTHQSIDGNLYCTVEIWDQEKKQWIAKQDVGTTSYAEKEKGQASDSFKRACFNVGIGRELYTAPFIWIAAAKITILKKGDRYLTNEHFRVQQIQYNEKREITELTILNSHGQKGYDLKAPQGTPPEDTGTSKRRALEKELERTGVPLQKVLERYHVNDINQLTPPMYTHAINSLKKTESKQVA